MISVDELIKEAKKYYKDEFDKDVERRFRRAYSRAKYERKVQMNYERSSPDKQKMSMAVKLVHLARRIGADSYEYYTSPGETFRKYPRVKMFMPDGTKRRYYFHKGRWRKS